MKIATWNVNSLRARADRVEDWLRRTDVDVLAIQETKCKDENFPWELFENNGYEVAHFGLSQWNGVAIASRVGLDDVERTFLDQPAFGKGGKDAVQEARAIAATCGGVRIWSLYVPNGRALDDEHMPYKTQLAGHASKDHAGGWLSRGPAGADRADGRLEHRAPGRGRLGHRLSSSREGLTHVSAPERAAFHAFEEAGFTDVVRPLHPGPGVYTYWDYTQLRFPKKEGMRIDFILASPALAARVTGRADRPRGAQGQGRLGPRPRDRGTELAMRNGLYLGGTSLPFVSSLRIFQPDGRLRTAGTTLYPGPPAGETRTAPPLTPRSWWTPWAGSPGPAGTRCPPAPRTGSGPCS